MSDLCRAGTLASASPSAGEGAGRRGCPAVAPPSGGSVLAQARGHLSPLKAGARTRDPEATDGGWLGVGGGTSTDLFNCREKPKLVGREGLQSCLRGNTPQSTRTLVRLSRVQQAGLRSWLSFQVSSPAGQASSCGQRRGYQGSSAHWGEGEEGVEERVG